MSSQIQLPTHSAIYSFRQRPVCFEFCSLDCVVLLTIPSYRNMCRFNSGVRLPTSSLLSQSNVPPYHSSSTNTSSSSHTAIIGVSSTSATSHTFTYSPHHNSYRPQTRSILLLRHRLRPLPNDARPRQSLRCVLAAYAAPSPN